MKKSIIFLLIALAAVSTAFAKGSTRKISGGTKIIITVGDVTIPATLNDSTSAKELIKRLPYTVTMHKYAHDYCTVMNNPLPYDKSDVHYGWLNGDIDFATDGPYFTILYKDEAASKQFGYQVNIGVVDCDLSVLDKLPPEITLTMTLAK